tara:strand:+ start:3812 stop:4831 length:1020 start_codon:yes stop_codon:yes gene_type:complete
MKVYKVGGAVRDSFLGVIAEDNDWVVIGSSPEEMIAKGYKPIGKDFPVFLHPETNEEYALARTEKKSGTGYHGFTFYFGKDVTLEEDLSRRDFTINAIAEDDSGNIVDPYNGRKDIENKLFRHVSDAFYEDPLRAIRLARFHTYDHLKNFTIDKLTIKSVNNIVSNGEIAKLSSDRVWSETSRALKSNNPSIYFEKIISLNLQDPFFKNLNNPFCDSHEQEEIRWSELQINNDFDLGGNLPIPNGHKNISEILRNISRINANMGEDDLISILISSNFRRNKEIIDKLIMLPNLKDTKDYISKLASKIKIADFSFLTDMPKEKIRAEKSKIYKQIIHKCK